jgi:hypothetical protein
MVRIMVSKNNGKLPCFFCGLPLFYRPTFYSLWQNSCSKEMIVDTRFLVNDRMTLDV